jgi:hypothetical protein
MLDDKYRLCAAEQAARDRVYAYLSNCPEIMDIINEPSFTKTAEMMKQIKVCSLTKIFCVVAVREIWQQTYPDVVSPVGTWESIDSMRMLASSDFRVQAAQTAVAMWDHHEWNEADTRIELEKYLEGIESGGFDNPVASALFKFLPLVVERLMQITNNLEGDERIAAAEKFCTEFHNDEEFNPFEKDFDEKVDKLCAHFSRKIESFEKEENDG